MNPNISLVGFMGVGKTAIGKALATNLNRHFVETDSLIEQRAGKSIPQIFLQDGEIAFRELEIQVIKEVSALSDQVIACGGGVVLNKINIDRLRRGGIVAYLTAPPSVILKRLTTSPVRRPLLEVPDPAAEIRRLMKERKPFYEMAADITIDTSRLDIQSAAAQIADRVKGNEGCNIQR